MECAIHSPKTFIKPFVKYVTVILDLRLDKGLDYGLTEEQANVARPGMRVSVPVRGKPRTGFILDIKDTPNFPSVQGVESFVSETVLISQDVFELALWMSRYYVTPLSQIFKIIMPATLRKEVKFKEQLYVMRKKTKEELVEFCQRHRSKTPAQAAIVDEMLKVSKGILLSELLELSKSSRSAVDALVKKELLAIDIVRVDRSPLINEEYFKTPPKQLNAQQQAALDSIVSSINTQKFAVHLLFGITGSGKTEVYLQAIDAVLKQGKSAIVLVPEIALTAQTIERFRSRFDCHIAILHHRLSDGERFDEWHKILEGEAKIIIGARSAIFSPAKNLGIVIVDEEHEGSYKQNEEMPTYHARDIAVMRGKIASCPVLLGSATPSLESYFNATQQKYQLNILSQRAEASSLPTVQIINMNKEFEKSKGFTIFSDPLLDKIKKRLTLGEKTILFLNRRGYHTTLFCSPCQKGITCRHCDTTLTFHFNEQRLTCHLCGFTVSPPPKVCPTCKQEDMLKYRGVGTEQVERTLHAILPQVRTLRVDADTTRHKGSHQRLFRDFGTGKADVLIGTQMIAKGLHFPDVTLVGVLNTDSSLNIPDYRASETVFQLITQVSGRAGRGALAGEVIIQTCMPDNSTIKLASEQDFESFYREEIESRKMFDFPPCLSMVKIVVMGLDQQQTCQFAEFYRQTVARELPSHYIVNPTVPSGRLKIKDYYYYQFLIRGPSIYPISDIINKNKLKLRPPHQTKILIDINPLSTYF